MLVNKNFRYSNKFFFINFLKFIFFKSTILAFVFLMNHSTPDLFFFRNLAKRFGLGVVTINSSLVSNLVVNGLRSFLFNVLVIYANDFASLFSFIKESSSKFLNFDFFSILLNNYFLSVEDWTHNYALSSSSNFIIVFFKNISFIVLFFIINAFNSNFIKLIK